MISGAAPFVVPASALGGVRLLPAEDLTPFSGVQHPSSDELDDAFYAKADQLSITAAERFARAMARFRASGGVTTVTPMSYRATSARIARGSPL